MVRNLLQEAWGVDVRSLSQFSYNFSHVFPSSFPWGKTGSRGGEGRQKGQREEGRARRKGRSRGEEGRRERRERDGEDTARTAVSQPRDVDSGLVINISFPG